MMNKLRLERFVVACAAAVLLFGTACRKQAVVQQPAPPRGPDPKAVEYVAKGDDYLQRDHLTGWRMAEDYYSKAYALEPSPELKHKLLLSRVLLMARAIDEDVSLPEVEKAVMSDCMAPANPAQEWLCGFAQRYSGPLRPVQKGNTDTKLDVPEFGQDPALAAYLYILNSQALGIEVPKDYRATVSEKFKDSALFLYFNLRRLTAQRAEELEKNLPDFAELYVLKGEKQMQAQRYQDSRASFKRALELVPEYTRAINGLGNIYLYVLEEYAKAMTQYETALRFDPSNAGALYGKGAVLHSLGRFADSNRVLDQVLATDLTRRGRVDTSTIQFYRGMSRYYQAYNHYLMFSPDEARKMIDLAKQSLPNAEQVNYLSGLLYFNANKMEEARVDFEKVISAGSGNCDAYNYLGLIHLQIEESRAITYFLGMCSCSDSAIINLNNQIAMLPKLDLEPADRDALGAKLRQKLTTVRKSAGDIIRNAIKMVDLTSNPRKEMYMKLMDEHLQRVAETPATP